MTGVGLLLSLVAVVAFLASAGRLGRGSPYLGAAALALGFLGILYPLFGNRDWSPGDEARHHAAFPVLFVGLQAAGVVALRALVGPDAPHRVPLPVLGFASPSPGGSPTPAGSIGWPR